MRDLIVPLEIIKNFNYNVHDIQNLISDSELIISFCIQL